MQIVASIISWPYLSCDDLGWPVSERKAFNMCSAPLGTPLRLPFQVAPYEAKWENNKHTKPSTMYKAVITAKGR